jgi:hypothetical protein
MECDLQLRMTALKLWQIGFSDFFSGGGLYNFLPENPRPCADRPETVAQQLDYLNLVTIPVDAHRLIQDVLAQVGWQSDRGNRGEGEAARYWATLRG